MSNTEIAQQLEAYSERVTGGAILESTENLPVRVRLTNANRASLTQLASLDLRPGQSRDHAFRPTTALGKFGLIGESSNIAHQSDSPCANYNDYDDGGVCAAAGRQRPLLATISNCERINLHTHVELPTIPTMTRKRNGAIGLDLNAKSIDWAYRYRAPSPRG